MAQVANRKKCGGTKLIKKSWREFTDSARREQWCWVGMGFSSTWKGDLTFSLYSLWKTYCCRLLDNRQLRASNIAIPFMKKTSAPTEFSLKCDTAILLQHNLSCWNKKSKLSQRCVGHLFDWRKEASQLCGIAMLFSRDVLQIFGSVGTLYKVWLAWLIV